MPRAHEGRGEVLEPLRVGGGVVVEVGDDLAARHEETRIARAGEAAVRGADQTEAVLLHDGRGRVSGPVVHHDDLEVGIVEPAQPRAAVADGAHPVVGADDDRNAGPALLRRERDVRERLTHRPEGGFGRAVDGREAEAPIRDITPVAMPLVSPGEDEDAGAAEGERGADLPVQRLGLPPLAVAHAVEPELAHDQRAVAREVLQPRHVRFEPVLRFQVDVEAHEIQERQLEILGGGIVHVSDESPRVFVPHDAGEALEVALHAVAAEPASQRRRDFVAERVAEQRGMAGAGAHFGADQCLDVGRAAAIDQIADVLLGRKADHDAEAVALGDVEQRAGRHRVGDANGGDPIVRHGGEVPFHHREVEVLAAVGGGREGPVGDATDVQLLVADEQELPPCPGAGECGRLGGGVGKGRSSSESSEPDGRRGARMRSAAGGPHSSSPPDERVVRLWRK